MNSVDYYSINKLCIEALNEWSRHSPMTGVLGEISERLFYIDVDRWRFVVTPWFVNPVNISIKDRINFDSDSFSWVELSRKPETITRLEKKISGSIILDSITYYSHNDYTEFVFKSLDNNYVVDVFLSLNDVGVFVSDGDKRVNVATQEQHKIVFRSLLTAIRKAHECILDNINKN